MNLATGTQNLFTGAKLIAIFIVVAGGVVRIVQGETTYISSGFESSKTSFSDIATAFYSKYASFIGLIGPPPPPTFKLQPHRLTL